jgi:hypothetical protein
MKLGRKECETKASMRNIVCKATIGADLPAFRLGKPKSHPVDANKAEPSILPTSLKESGHHCLAISPSTFKVNSPRLVLTTSSKLL